MSEICYNCPALATTRDHVPATGFFPTPKPSNLITVPCCAKCNASFSLDDEAFRAWVVAPDTISEAGKWIRVNKVYQNTFKRSPKLVEHMRQHMSEVMVDGKAVDVLNFPADRANRFLVRITKGLLATFYPAYPRNEQEYRVVAVDPANANLELLERLRDEAEYAERGNGVFQFRRHVRQEEEWGYWLLSFYEGSLFLVSHRSLAKAKR